MTQPEGERSGGGGAAVREECCAFKKKAVFKDLKFPVAFEPPLKGIMASSRGLPSGYKEKGFGQKISQWILYGSQNSIANQPQGICHTYSHTEQLIARQRFCAECPSLPTPITLNPCLTPWTPKTKSFIFLVGSNIYSPLRIELETSHDFKKSCSGQKESGEAFSLSA